MVCWPIPTAGRAATPYRPGSTSDHSVTVPAPANSASVVHAWPDAGTHCRSSAQIAQVSGGVSSSAVSTAQVAQIQIIVRP